MRRLQFCLVLLAFLALTCGAFAQVQNGQFTGTVTDPTGAAIANAKVTVTNEGINLSQTVTTNSSGNYTAKELPIGNYKLTAEAPGFKTLSNSGVTLNAGSIAHVDFKLQVGKASEVVEVTGAAAQVNTEDSKLATTVSSTQINNLPLNGRNVFDLMQMATGAVNVKGTDFENGHSTVVNGLREDFNGFLINGVSNKGLSGGAVNTPIQDSVEEFQQLQLNMSAQYGNSAGGTVNLVTKSGTNNWHGSAWEFLRNDAVDANWFFNNQGGVAKQPLRFNQFGLTVGGPIVKDKLFFFLSLQGDRFKTSQVPTTFLQESDAWRNAVIAADQADGLNSTAAVLYNDFKPSNPGTATATSLTADKYFTNKTTHVINYAKALCLDDGVGGPPNGLTGLTTLQHQKLATIFGMTAQDVVDLNAAGCTNLPNGGVPFLGTLDQFGGRTAAIRVNGISTAKTQTDSLGNLFNGNEGGLRVDYNWNASNRMFFDIDYLRETDNQGPCPTTSCGRGFTNPTRNLFPHGSFSFIHTFSPTILNEFRAGYLQNNTLLTVSTPGVPAVGFSDGSAFFGAYNGYPQAFKENIYTYSDMVSISHGNHNMKIGVDFRRNIENSEFNIARPSYYFYDQVYFAADAPYLQLAGVDPGICKAPCPASSYNPNPQAQLSDNFRHWRNLEFGTYFQDDWKVTKRLTLNLGLRYDLFQRHHEEGNYATTFIPGPGANLVEQIANANAWYGTGNCTAANNVNVELVPLAGVCGPGGFAPSSSLGKGDHNNFGPRVGFAWDLFGNGKTSLRGGFGVAYEGTLYNPLSNSRWNYPYYTFNEILAGGTNVPGQSIVYGPSVCDPACHQVSNVPVTYLGDGSNPNQGPVGQPQAHGNISGWDPSNANKAYLTGIIFPQGVRDPYVYNFYLDIQHEIMPKTVLDVKYVGTAGHKLFRAEDVNRRPGTVLPSGMQVTDNLGHTWTGVQDDVVNPDGRLNANYLKLRAWENVVNSNYNSLQLSVKHQMSHGLMFNVDYTYSHSIDNGSTWHSGATSANGAAAGEGYTTSNVFPGLDRGNSIFDFRHRLVLNYVYQLPGQNLKGALGVIAGGWSYNGIWSFQTGPHFETYTSSGPGLTELTIVDPIGNPDGNCTQADLNDGNCANAGGDFNLDGGRNDRPNASVKGVSGISHNAWANGWYPDATSTCDDFRTCTTGGPGPSITFSAPCPGCVGNLGRNTFVGPSTWYADMTLSKTFKFTERVNLKFDASAFNIFNHTNFLLAHAGGYAHNKYYQDNFGQADATLNPRQMQFGLKLSF